MYINSLNMINFCPFSYEQTIPFTAKTIFISGQVLGNNQFFNSNGAGKSSVLNAIVWCLFGKTPNRLDKDNVIHYGARDVLVTVSFSNGLKVTRTKTRGRPEKLECSEPVGTVYNDLAYQQQMLNDYLKVDYNLFINAFYLGREVFDKSFIKMTSSERLKIMESIFGGDIFLKAQNVAKQYYKKNEDETNLTQHRREATHRNIESKKLDKQRLQEKIVELSLKQKEEKQSKQKQIAELEKRIEESKTSINECLNIINILKENIVATKTKQSKLHNDKIKLSLDISNLKDLTEGFCPTCNQIIPTQLADANTKKGEMLREAILLNDRNLKECQQEYDKLSSSLEDTQKKMQEHRNIYHQNLGKLESLQDITDDNPIEVYQEEIGYVEQSIAELNEELSEIDALLLRLNEKNKYASFWVKGFGVEGIRSMLLDDIKIILSEYSNYWLRNISGENYRITLPVTEDKEQFSIEIYKGNDLVNFKALSVGQTWRINFALMLGVGSTLKKLCGTELDFVMLDDLFEGLDDQGVDSMLSLIQNELTQRFSKILVTAPRDYKNTNLTIKHSNGKSYVGGRQ